MRIFTVSCLQRDSRNQFSECSCASSQAAVLSSRQSRRRDGGFSGPELLPRLLCVQWFRRAAEAPAAAGAAALRLIPGGAARERPAGPCGAPHGEPERPHVRPYRRTLCGRSPGSDCHRAQDAAWPPL